MKNNVVAFAVVILALMIFSKSGKAQIRPPMASFSDVPSNHWAELAIEKMATGGVIESDPKDHFRGNDAMTRYEFVVAMSRLLSQPMPSPYYPIQQDIQRIEMQLKALDERLKTLEEKVKAAPAVLIMPEDLSDLRSNLAIATQTTIDLTKPTSTIQVAEKNCLEVPVMSKQR